MSWGVAESVGRVTVISEKLGLPAVRSWLEVPEVTARPAPNWKLCTSISSLWPSIWVWPVTPGILR